MSSERAPAAVQPLEFEAGKRQLFVVGNEAADVDSLVSAFALAAALAAPSVQTIPLAQITREEFRLRGDGLLLFQRAGVEVACDGSPLGLRFWDEVDWDKVRTLENRSVALTDHNEMSAKLKDIFDGKVELILDHHADSRCHPEATKCLDESLGSACTLVAERLLEAPAPVPAHVGKLLAGVILLDCRNFGQSPNEASKGTPRDRAVLDRLAEHVPEAGESAWYEELKRARYDVSHLSAKELLMLDMKAAPVAGFEGMPVAFSSMMASLDECCRREGGPAALQEAMRNFARARGFRGVVALFSQGADKLKALALVPASDEHRAALDAIEARVMGAPGNLPESLRENPLYEAQAILTEGFGLQPRDDVAPLRAFSMRAEISRKTLLPRAAEDAVSNL